MGGGDRPGTPVASSIQPPHPPLTAARCLTHRGSGIGSLLCVRVFGGGGGGYCGAAPSLHGAGRARIIHVPALSLETEELSKAAEIGDRVQDPCARR